MDIVVGIIGMLLAGVSIILIYRMGVSDGAYRERIRLINILERDPILKATSDITPNQRYGVLCVTNYIVGRLRER